MHIAMNSRTEDNECFSLVFLFGVTLFDFAHRSYLYTILQRQWVVNVGWTLVECCEWSPYRDGALIWSAYIEPFQWVTVMLRSFDSRPRPMIHSILSFLLSLSVLLQHHGGLRRFFLLGFGRINFWQFMELLNKFADILRSVIIRFCLYFW